MGSEDTIKMTMPVYPVSDSAFSRCLEGNRVFTYKSPLLLEHMPTCGTHILFTRSSGGASEAGLVVCLVLHTEGPSITEIFSKTLLGPKQGIKMPEIEVCRVDFIAPDDLLRTDDSVVDDTVVGSFDLDEDDTEKNY